MDEKLHSTRRLESRLSKLDKVNEINFGEKMKITRDSGNIESEGNVSAGKLQAGTTVELPRLAEAPEDAPDGTLFYNTATNELMVRKNEAWVNVDTTVPQ